MIPPVHRGPVDRRKLPAIGSWCRRALLAVTLLLIGLPAAAQEGDAVATWRKANQVAVLPITGPIDQVTATSLKRRLSEAVQDGAEAIVFEIDTPGGELMSTLEICRMIKYDAPDNTVAWIHPFAFSAGTIIALACREIVISPDATFGDSAPVSPLGAIPEAERAKLESPILAEVVDSARRRHYDEQLVQAFVSVGVELWLLSNTQTGQSIFVDAAEYERIFGEPPPTELIDVSSPELAEGVEPVVSPFFKAMESPGEPLAEDSIAYEQLLPSSRPRLGPEDAGEWQLVGQVVADDRLLTLKASEALNYGLGAAVVDTQAELAAFLGATDIRVYKQSWSESFVQFLISWPARITLIVIFLVCLFVEMLFPGTGLFAIGAAIALALLIGAPALAGLAQWWDILAVVLGMALIATELFLIPGTLFAGLAGAVLLLIGIIGTFVSGDMTDQEMQFGIVQGILVVLSGSFLAGLILWLLTRTIERDTIGRGLVLQSASSGAGHTVVPPSSAEVTEGTHGRAETDLRPAGRVWIDDQLLDAVSLGRWISAGSPVRVVRNGLVLEVEEVDPS